MSKKIIILLLTLYQKFFSPDTGIFGGKNICVFYPTCSEYAKIAIEKYGFAKGAAKSIGRVLRCHPWQKQREDMP